MTKESPLTSLYRQMSPSFQKIGRWPLLSLSPLLSLLLAGLLANFSANACLSGPEYSREPTVTLAWHERAKRLAILASDLKLNARIQPPSAMPYSDNASTAIWLGTEFPYDKAIQMIRWGHNYYKELRYIALSDLASPATERYDYDLFLGGATKKALKLKLKAWSPADFRKLYRAKNQARFHALIRSHYGRN